MKHMLRTKPLHRVLILLLAVLSVSVFDSRSISAAQFALDFGHAGTFRILKGQVRFSDDFPIAHATLSITKLGIDKEYVIETDEDGNFIKADLPSGKYNIRVRGTGTNIGQFTMRISQGGPYTSSKYIIIKLSPGCASGDAGLKTVSKIKNK